MYTGGGVDVEALKIIISGIIDGITGFLPVSSSGHMAVLRNVLHFGGEDSILFDMLLKLAAIVVIVVGFRKDMLRLVKAFIELVLIGFNNLAALFSNIVKRDQREYYPVSGAYKRLAMMILVATVSTGIVGVCGRDFAAYAAGTVLLPGIFLVVTGIMLFLIDGIKKGEVSIKDAGLFEAFVIGGVQGLAVMPGLARCGMVIAVCLLFGFDRKLTWKFTFLAAVPSLIGTVILDIADMVHYGIDDAGNTGWYILAALLAVVTGYIGLVLLNRILKRGRFMVLSIYCLVLGAFTLASIVVL